MRQETPVESHVWRIGSRMILPDDQVVTREVKSWQGLHLLQFQSSAEGLVREAHGPPVVDFADWPRTS